MAALTHLDTHVVAWLYLVDSNRLSDDAASAIRTGTLSISPMVMLELAYLHEIERLNVEPDLVLRSLQEQLGLELDESPFPEVVSAAASMTWTRDPFDRIISAQAVTAEAQLVTRDVTIRANLPQAVW